MSCVEAVFTLMAATLTAWDALASLITVHTPVDANKRLSSGCNGRAGEGMRHLYTAMDVFGGQGWGHGARKMHGARLFRLVDGARGWG